MYCGNILECVLFLLWNNNVQESTKPIQCFDIKLNRSIADQAPLICNAGVRNPGPVMYRCKLSAKTALSPKQLIMLLAFV